MAVTKGVRSLTPLDGIPDPDGADCVSCGRCCHHPANTVSFHAEDEVRAGEEILTRLTIVYESPPHFRFMKNDGTRCAGLDVSVEGQFRCSIYKERPSGCREVEPGSPCCLEARRLGHLGTSVEFKRVV